MSPGPSSTNSVLCLHEYAYIRDPLHQRSASLKNTAQNPTIHFGQGFVSTSCRSLLILTPSSSLLSRADMRHSSHLSAPDERARDTSVFSATTPCISASALILMSSHAQNLDFSIQVLPRSYHLVLLCPASP